MTAMDTPPAVDSILFEVVKNALDSIADEMALIIMRSAYSSIVRDTMDFSTAICDAQGRTLAQGLTTPLHLGSFFDALECLLDQAAGRIFPEDVFVFNDPYSAGGQHLPDIYVIKPIFIAGVLQGFATTVAHHNDVGGIIAGSNSIGATEIFQEGLCLPIVKLYERGEPVDPVWRIIERNVRVPDKVFGDLRAQIAGCRAGERGFARLFERYGAPTVIRCFEEVHDYAERLVRAELGDMPDGTYRFTDHIDGLGETPEPIVFKVAVTISGDTVHVDWTGTSGEVRGGINAPFPYTKSAAYAVLRCVMSSAAPHAEGFTRPVTVTAPPGSIVNPRHPAACGARGITGLRMMDCLFGALAQAVPDRVPADGSDGACLPTIAGRYQGRAFVFVETMMGNWGAHPDHDGQEGMASLAANQSNVPAEVIERTVPLRIERYGVLPDTGGPGRHRGGLSVVRDYRLLADEGMLSVRSDKRRFRPHGLHGGGEGGPSWNILNPEGEARILPTLMTTPLTLRKGDVYRHVTAGGGGYGPALEREPERVLEDVRQRKVSIAQARAAYGVAITPALQIDRAETARLRGG